MQHLPALQRVQVHFKNTLRFFQNELRNPALNHYLSDTTVTIGDDEISYGQSLLEEYKRQHIGLGLFFLKSPGYVTVERMLALDEK
jgi:hypothetical protein